MEVEHRFAVTAAPTGLLFECEEGCGRRLAVDRTTGAMTVIERGDPLVNHRGGHTDVQLDRPVVQPG